MPLQRAWMPSPQVSSRGGTPVRLLIVHTAEGARTFRDLGGYFQSPAAAAAQTSSHVGIDDTAGVIGEYVQRDRKAWTAGNANPVSVNAELCAFARWDRAEWLRHPTMLANTGTWIAEEAARYGIPIVKSSARGVCGHVDVSGPGGHWDPGPNFPWDVVLAHATGHTPAPPAPTPTPQPPPSETEDGKDMIIASTPTGKGYIVAKPDGAVFAYGDARYRGGANTGHLQPGDRITDATYAADGSGYWLVADSGAVFAYGPSFYGRPD